MKQLIYITLSLLGFNAYTQTFHLKINGINPIETKIIDSLQYQSNHSNLKSLLNEVNSTAQGLLKKGYLDIKTPETTKINDTTYNTIINLKNRTKFIHIYIGINKSFFKPTETKNDSIIIQYDQLENYLNQKIIDAEKNGYALSKIKLENIKRKNSTIYADLNFKSEKKRTVNSIIINYDNDKNKRLLPKGHIKQLNKKYINKTFNQEILNDLYEDINNFEFLTQTKYPEILFTKDSTKIYIYPEKKRANTFDGYIGFSNDEDEKLRFNGYLDITLQNTLRAGEQFSLYWKSDGEQQTTFNTKIEIPYIFQSSLGVKAQLNIFKQDSTFQNTKTSIDLGYYIKYNSKIYLGYQSTESSDIQNTNSSLISDFKNSYITSTFDYKKNDNQNQLFFKKAIVNLILGYGKRNTNNNPSTANPSKQIFTNFNILYNFELNEKNYININSQNFYLNSKNYISNELFRFGGINSIRGFSENSLQANFMSSILTEYRYIVSKNLYIHSIIDYGLYQDVTSNIQSKKIKKLTGIGFGVATQTANGLLRITLTNGTTNNEDIQLYNSIINLCYNVKF
ncbi:BamA/TamA family outer membrane protein [Flavobacterium hercynium]|uniref:POTRA domain-containing protein n=1 Tax=Flavobacterium hercynium TaxID=387094 RepID=A0A226HD87_9FLAO|nr:hypothetical protein [Flavobacterium hercynium]OXA92257.1 hypothetical protein B0A66_10190 [Flavobacterium hercynium]